MNLLKKTLKVLGLTILSLIIFVGGYFLFAYFLSRITIENEKNSIAEMAIYIKTNGVHTDLIVPVKNDLIDWSKEVEFENTMSKDTNMKWLGMGWGDKGFYLNTPTWADLKFSTAFKAMFAMSTTAIHATYYDTLSIGDSCLQIVISKDQYSRLINYINNSFQKDSYGHFINIKTNANYGKQDAFYEALGSYSMFHTCNTWANNGLKFCGLKACLWTPFDTGIFLKYKNNN
jgi:uncharacterized protein (TIGR02117 family)